MSKLKELREKIVDVRKKLEGLRSEVNEIEVDIYTAEEESVNIEFSGFESLIDLEGDIMDALDELGVSGEYSGTVTINVSYREES